MKRLCGDYEYSFEPLQGVYVCDIDVKSIHLDQERSDCPLKSKAEHVPCPICSNTFFSWNNALEVMTRTCKACGHTQQVHAKEAA